MTPRTRVKRVKRVKSGEECYGFAGKCGECKYCLGIYKDSGKVICQWYDDTLEGRKENGCGVHWEKRK